MFEIHHLLVMNAITLFTIIKINTIFYVNFIKCQKLNYNKSITVYITQFHPVDSSKINGLQPTHLKKILLKSFDSNTFVSYRSVSPSRRSQSNNQLNTYETTTNIST